jgi:excisionase family DNA binding protein
VAAGDRTPRTAAVEFEQLLTLREAADLLGIHWKTLEIQARRGEIPATKIGNRWRFRTSVLDTWLTSRFGPTGTPNPETFDAKLAAQPRRAS